MSPLPGLACPLNKGAFPLREGAYPLTEKAYFCEEGAFFLQAASYDCLCRRLIAAQLGTMKVPSKCPLRCHLYSLLLGSGVELLLFVVAVDVEDREMVFVPYFFWFLEDCLVVSSN